jgi:signal transduction histidine kinase
MKTKKKLSNSTLPDFSAFQDSGSSNHPFFEPGLENPAPSGYESDFSSAGSGFTTPGIDMRVLFHLSNVLRQGQSIEEKTPLLLDKIKQITGAGFASLALLEGDDLVFVTGSEIKKNDLAGQRISYCSDPLWNAIRSGLVQSDLLHEEDDAEKMDGFFGFLTGGLAAYVVIPLITSESVIGIIFLGFTEQPAALPETNEIYSVISNMVGNAFNQIRAKKTLEKIVSERSLELNTLYQILALVNQSGDLQDAFQQALMEILNSTGFSMGGILLLDELEEELNLISGINIPKQLWELSQHLPLDGSIAGKVIRSGKNIIDELVTEESIPFQSNGLTLPLSYDGFPMRIQGRIIGVISLMGVPGRHLTIDQITLLTFIADHLALSVENYRLRKNAERSAVVEERARLAREFHDSVTQSLYSASLLSAASSELLKMNKLQELAENLERLSIVTQLSLKEMRLLVYELRSPALDEGGVVEAVRRRISAVEMRAGVNASIEVRNYRPMEVREEEELYRIALEGLNNSLKYSYANQVKIIFDLVDENVVLIIEDNGRGFDPVEAAEKGGFGIRTMRERTEKLGGNFKIESTNGSGTRLTACIPCREMDKISSYHSPGFN